METAKLSQKRKAIVIKESKSHVDALAGLGKEVWDALGGAEKYIREERAAWDKKSVRIKKN